MNAALDARALPANVEYEQAVLGSCLFSAPTAARVATDLTRNDFTHKAHRYLFDAIAALVLDGDPVDTRTVTEKLRANGRLDAVEEKYIHESVESVPTSKHADFYIDEVKRCSVLRALIEASRKMESACFGPDADPEAIIADQEKAVHAAAAGTVHSGESVAFSNVVLSVLGGIFAEGKAGIPTGISRLDEITNGWQGTDLVVVGGLPGSGKSCLANTFVKAAAKGGYPVHFFNLEMNNSQLANRFIASETGISMSEFRPQYAETHCRAVGRASGTLGDLPIEVSDGRGISEITLRSQARQTHRRKGTRLIVIDYLQRIPSSGKQDSENAAVTQVIGALKDLAVELSVPVIVLSSLSRESARVARGEGGSSRKPVLSDLRASGSIESDADIVMFVYRPDYHQASSNADSPAELIVSKHRNGALGTIQLRFEKSRSRFVEIDTHHDAPPDDRRVSYV